MNDNKEKTKETLANIWKKTADISKKAASGISKGAKNISEHTRENIRNHQINKYKPLTAEEFRSQSFNIPNVIEIVDDAVRRDIEVCKGAIGWTEKHNDVEVLHLYDEFVNESKLNFVPIPRCDNVYYVDPFDKTRYINANIIHTKVAEEKIAELENIAFCLGAKSFSVEILENDAEVTSTNVSANVNNTANLHAGIYADHSNRQSGKAKTHFEGHDSPRRPNLKWFTYDDSIKSLIEMRCSNTKSIKSRVLELKASATASMSIKVACAIDKILKVKGNISLERKSIREHSTSLLFEVEF